MQHAVNTLPRHSGDGHGPREAAGSRVLLPISPLQREQGLNFHSSNAKNNMYDQRVSFISGDCESAEGLL